MRHLPKLRKMKRIKEQRKKIENQIGFKRKVKTGLILKKAIAYRIVVTLSQIILMYLFTRSLELSIGFSIFWNIWNTGEYFAFDYLFSRFYSVGK